MAIKDIKVLQTIKEGQIIYPAQTETSKPTAAPDRAGMTYRWRMHVCDMTEANQAAGKDWKLKSLEGVPIETESRPTMKFQRGELIVFGGVNRIVGSYALLENRSVTIGRLTATERAGPPELQALENRFSKILASVDGFHVEGNRLDLLSGIHVVAVFTTEE